MGDDCCTVPPWGIEALASAEYANQGRPLVTSGARSLALYARGVNT